MLGLRVDPKDCIFPSCFGSFVWPNRCQVSIILPMVSAGFDHTVLLRSDGEAVACGLNDFGQCDIPCLEDGIKYTQVSAGQQYSVLLRSDGIAVACGMIFFGQCDIPPLPDGMTYTQVSAGLYHTVLLRSDGIAVACGTSKQCDILTQYFLEAMATLWFTDRMILTNATFRS